MQSHMTMQPYTPHLWNYLCCPTLGKPIDVSIRIWMYPLPGFPRLEARWNESPGWASTVGHWKVSDWPIFFIGGSSEELLQPHTHPMRPSDCFQTCACCRSLAQDMQLLILLKWAFFWAWRPLNNYNISGPTLKVKRMSSSKSPAKSCGFWPKKAHQLLEQEIPMKHNQLPSLSSNPIPFLAWALGPKASTIWRPFSSLERNSLMFPFRRGREPLGAFTHEPHPVHWVDPLGAKPIVDGQLSKSTAAKSRFPCIYLESKQN